MAGADAEEFPDPLAVEVARVHMVEQVGFEGIGLGVILLKVRE